jgi:hypothetical protein
MSSRTKKLAIALGTAGLAAGGFGAASLGANTASAASQVTTFPMVRSAAAEAGGAGCIPNAAATVKVTRSGIVEIMDVNVSGLPKNTDFDLFVIQVPNKPFGVSWYQGDLETDKNGNGHGRYRGRFSVETFAIAPDVAPAPSVHSSGSFPDATSNPAFAPIHTYHLGLWFNDPADAGKAGCPTTVTPFNGEHNAGIQALSTRQAPDDHGPLRDVVS